MFEVGSILNISINLEYGFWCKECKASNGRHISILDEHYNHAYCFWRKPTALEVPHKIWLTVRTYVHRVVFLINWLFFRLLYAHTIADIIDEALF